MIPNNMNCRIFLAAIFFTQLTPLSQCYAKMHFYSASWRTKGLLLRVLRIEQQPLIQFCFQRIVGRFFSAAIAWRDIMIRCELSGSISKETVTNRISISTSCTSLDTSASV